jgi:hypothetical protein
VIWDNRQAERDKQGGIGWVDQVGEAIPETVGADGDLPVDVHQVGQRDHDRDEQQGLG